MKATRHSLLCINASFLLPWPCRLEVQRLGRGSVSVQRLLLRTLFAPHPSPREPLRRGKYHTQKFKHQVFNQTHNPISYTFMLCKHICVPLLYFCVLIMLTSLHERIHPFLACICSSFAHDLFTNLAIIWSAFYNFYKYKILVYHSVVENLAFQSNRIMLVVI